MEKEIENELQGFENAVSNLEEEKQKEIQIEYVSEILNYGSCFFLSGGICINKEPRVIV